MNTTGIKILVIDDEQSLREMVSFVLRSKGVEVLEAESGKQGIELALTTQPNLILCDISMGETGGFEVFNQLQQQAQTARIPFVLMSGLTGFSQAPAEIKECVTLMEKPFSMQTLLKVVANKIRDESGAPICLSDPPPRSKRTRHEPLPKSASQKNQTLADLKPNCKPIANPHNPNQGDRVV